MNKKILKVAIVLMAFSLKASLLSAAEVDGKGADFSSNESKYIVVVKDKPISWVQARDEAISLGGHLATITSAEEQKLVWDIVRKSPESWSRNSDDFYLGPWLGGFKMASKERTNSGWKWVTDEPFLYTAWERTQPNNFGYESGLVFLGRKERAPDWADYFMSPPGTVELPKIHAFVVEKELIENIETNSQGVTSTDSESEWYTRVINNRAESLCSSLGVKCKDVIVKTCEAWLDEMMQQTISSMNARRKFEMLFSNSGAINPDAERLQLFEEIIADSKLSNGLQTKLNSEFISRKDIGFPQLDASAVQNIAADVALDIITGLAIESVAAHKERAGDKEAAYWVRTVSKPAIDIGVLAKGLAAGSVSVTSGAVAAGAIWAKNAYSYLLLGTRLNADEKAGRDVENQLKILGEQNESIFESLRSKETRGVIFKDVTPSRKLTNKEVKILEQQLISNNRNQIELLKQQAIFVEFDWLTQSSKYFAAKLQSVAPIVPKATRSGIEHANSTESLPLPKDVPPKEPVKVGFGVPKLISNKGKGGIPTNWDKDPKVKALIDEVMQNSDPISTNACSKAYGPLTNDQNKKLLLGKRFKYNHFLLNRGELEHVVTGKNFKEIFTGRRPTPSGYCLSLMSCSLVYYCPSSQEVPFVIGNFILTSMSPINVEPVTKKIIDTLFIEGEGHKTLIDPETNCKAKVSGWMREATQIKWNGGCTNGFISGKGEILWKDGHDVIWETNVGPDWGTTLYEGLLALKVDLGEFEFKIDACKEKGFTNRVTKVTIAAPYPKPEPEYIPFTYFNNRWLVDELLRQAV